MIARAACKFLRPGGRRRQPTEQTCDYNQGEGTHGCYLHETLGLDANSEVHTAPLSVPFGHGAAARSIEGRLETNGTDAGNSSLIPRREIAPGWQRDWLRAWNNCLYSI
jgi:hypothetical protein